MSSSNSGTTPDFTAYQRDFIDTVVAEVGPGSVHVLVAPLGAGKLHAVVGAITELIETGRVQRVLFLTKTALMAQVHDRLRRHDKKVITIDARDVRALRDQLGGTADWPIGVYVMSMDAAKRPEIGTTLSHVTWDLVVAAEVDVLSKQRLQLLNGLSNKLRPPSFLFVSTIPLPEVYSQARVIDWRPELASLLPPIEFHMRGYQRSRDERALIDRIADNYGQLGPIRALMLLRRVSSSISSLEDSLLRWLNKPQRMHKGRQILEVLLEQVEELRCDERLSRFKELLGDLHRGGNSHIVVLCEYRATLDYLVAVLEDMGLQFLPMVIDDMRYVNMTEFRSNGGILVATSKALEGMILPVETVIHYDLPLSPASFARRHVIYNHFGRRGPCNVYYLVDESHTHPLEEATLRVFDRMRFGALVEEQLRDIKIRWRDLRLP